MCVDVHRSYGFVAKVCDASRLIQTIGPGPVIPGDSASMEHGTIQQFSSQDPVVTAAPDGETIMAIMRRMREKPVMIFPVSMWMHLVPVRSWIGDTPNHARASPDYHVFSHE